MKIIKLVLLNIALLSFLQCKEKINYKTLEENSPHNQSTESTKNKPFYQGTILEILEAGGYTYIKIQENLKGHNHDNCDHKDFWIAVEVTPAKVGNEVRFQKELVTQNFKSKTLNKTFDELMFASNLQHKVKKDNN